MHASVGLALAEGAADADADDLIRRADEAMYRAKHAGAAARLTRPLSATRSTASLPRTRR